MSEMMSGFVEDISSKGTRGKNDLWSIKVDGDWFGCGFEEPYYDVGAEVEFEIEMNGDFENVNVDTLVVLQEAPERGRGNGRGGNRDRGRGNSRHGSSRSQGSRRDSSRSNRSSGGRGGSNRSNSRGSSRRGGGQKEDKMTKEEWTRKDNLIRLQSAQNTSIRTIELMVTQGLVKLPAKKADHMDAVIALIEIEAKRLFDKYDDIADDIMDGFYERGTEDTRKNPDDERYAEDVPD